MWRNRMSAKNTAFLWLQPSRKLHRRAPALQGISFWVNQSVGNS
jgi:hypothetical protein